MVPSELGGGSLASHEEFLGAIVGRVLEATGGDATTYLGRGDTPLGLDAVREDIAAGVLLAELENATVLAGFELPQPVEGPGRHVDRPLHLPFAVCVKRSLD